MLYVVGIAVKTGLEICQGFGMELVGVAMELVGMEIELELTLKWMEMELFVCFV